MSNFCSKCGKEIVATASFCPTCGSTLQSNAAKQPTQSTDIEIKGDFPIAQSKIPLQLLDGEKLILQINAAVYSGAAKTGVLSLTNKRILFAKDGFGKSSLKSGAGLLGGFVSASVTVVPEIKISNIAHIEASSVGGQSAGVKVTTKDGYTHKYIFKGKLFNRANTINTRNSFVSLIQSAIAEKEA